MTHSGGGGGITAGRPRGRWRAHVVRRGGDPGWRDDGWCAGVRQRRPGERDGRGRPAGGRSGAPAGAGTRAALAGLALSVRDPGPGAQWRRLRAWSVTGGRAGRGRRRGLGTAESMSPASGASGRLVVRCPGSLPAVPLAIGVVAEDRTSWLPSGNCRNAATSPALRGCGAGHRRSRLAYSPCRVRPVVPRPWWDRGHVSSSRIRMRVATRRGSRCSVRGLAGAPPVGERGADDHAGGPVGIDVAEDE